VASGCCASYDLDTPRNRSGALRSHRGRLAGWVSMGRPGALSKVSRRSLYDAALAQAALLGPALSAIAAGGCSPIFQPPTAVVALSQSLPAPFLPIGVTKDGASQLRLRCAGALLGLNWLDAKAGLDGPTAVR